MEEVRFSFRRRTYKGFVDVSTKAYPHYYWIFFEDPDLFEELGHCIAFTKEYGSELLLATTGVHQHKWLIHTIKEAVEQFIHAHNLA